MRLTRSLTIVLTIALMLLLAACGGTATPTPTVIPAGSGETGYQTSVQFSPGTLTVGSAALIVTVTTGDGAPAAGLTVSARGDMRHAGMPPVLGEATEDDPGVYTIPWEWTMAGDWLVDVTVRAADGGEVVQTINVQVES